MIVLGFDPGGTSGVAILNAGANGVLISTGEVSSVSGAMKWFRESVADEEPMIVGIDAFLHWSLGRGGKRFVDELILKTCYPDSQKSILPQNSTYGAMAVQGMALAIEVRKIWPRIRLNEVHPKVLYFAMEFRATQESPLTNLAARERFFKCREWSGRVIPGRNTSSMRQSAATRAIRGLGEWEKRSDGSRRCSCCR